MSRSNTAAAWETSLRRAAPVIENDHSYAAVKVGWVTPWGWTRRERLRRNEYVYQTWPINWLRGGKKATDAASRGDVRGVAGALRDPNDMGGEDAGGEGEASIVALPEERWKLWLYVAEGLAAVALGWWAKRKGAFDRVPQVAAATAKLFTRKRK